MKLRQLFSLSYINYEIMMKYVKNNFNKQLAWDVPY